LIAQIAQSLQPLVNVEELRLPHRPPLAESSPKGNQIQPAEARFFEAPSSSAACVIWATQSPTASEREDVGTYETELAD